MRDSAKQGRKRKKMKGPGGRLATDSSGASAGGGKAGVPSLDLDPVATAAEAQRQLDADVRSVFREVADDIDDAHGRLQQALRFQAESVEEFRRQAQLNDLEVVSFENEPTVCAKLKVLDAVSQVLASAAREK
jgi:hypothetical protein